jgi:hypothetical protein
VSGNNRPEASRRIGRRSLIAIRLGLLAVSVVFVAVFAAEQYGLIRSFVRFLCLSCLGLSD